MWESVQPRDADPLAVKTGSTKLSRQSFRQSNQTQMLGNFIFYSSDYFSPLGFTGEQFFSDNTYSIHHFNGSWLDDNQIAMLNLRKRIRRFFGVFLGDYIFKILFSFEIIKKNGLIVFLKKLKQKIIRD